MAIKKCVKDLKQGDSIDTSNGVREVLKVGPITSNGTDTTGWYVDVQDSADPRGWSQLEFTLEGEVSAEIRPADLKDGRRYRLVYDVKNPKLDKRDRYRPESLAWTAGDVFRAAVWGGADSDRTRVSLEGLVMHATPRKTIGRIYPTHDGFEALCAGLELLPESASDICARYDLENVQHAVLRRLYETGKVSAADVEQACIDESKEDV